jgi:hypothetical protein
MGDLQKALSGSLLALVQADRIAREAMAGVVQATPAAISNGKAVEHDDRRSTERRALLEL